MNLLFLMDPLETVDFYKDTTFAFMLGADRRGHSVFFLPSGGISLRGNRAEFDVQRVKPHPDPEHLFDVSPPSALQDSQVDAVFIRTNPPFDAHYLMNTWLLDPLAKTAAILNHPAGIRNANEKIWSMAFPELMPPTLVTRDTARFEAFLEEHGSIVAKPTDGFGGAGVFLVRQDDPNAQVIYESLTQHGGREVVLQGLVPEASRGDKRILLLNGEILGAVMRVQEGRDHRNNFFAGGKPRPAEITARDQEIVDTLRPHLVEAGLYFTGIDILGDYLIEVNVTSPTCLQEVNRITGQQLEDRVLDFAEQLAAERKEGS